MAIIFMASIFKPQFTKSSLVELNFNPETQPKLKLICFEKSASSTTTNLVWVYDKILHYKSNSGISPFVKLPHSIYSSEKPTWKHM